MGPNRKVLFLAMSGRKGASSRYRVYDYLPYLLEAGIDSTVVVPRSDRRCGLSALFRLRRERNDIIAQAAGSDAVFIQKRLFPRRFIDALGATGRPIVFDFDDSVFTSPSGGWSYFTRKKVEARLSSVIRASSLVIAGNGFLAGFARAQGAKRVEVLPTAIELSKYRAKVHSDGPVVLGWIGSSVNHRYLDLLRGMLPGVAGKVPGLKLLVVSDSDYAMEGVEVENRRWSEQTEAADLLCMDIGLMPLSDDDWTRGKCALKALQYMACGIPAVCSPVGANNEVIDDGVDGFLPKTDSEWAARILELSASSEMRRTMGASGRRKVSERYETRTTAARLADLLGSLWV